MKSSGDMSIIEEKLELFREAMLYHSTREDVTPAEAEWLEWVKTRIEELKEGKE